VVWCFSEEFGSNGDPNLLPSVDLLAWLRQIAATVFFCSRSSLKFGYCENLAARQSPSASISEKYSVIPEGYVLLEICHRGSQFREMIAANLAAFASASAPDAIGGRRHRNGLPR